MATYRLHILMKCVTTRLWKQGRRCFKGTFVSFYIDLDETVEIKTIHTDKSGVRHVNKDLVDIVVISRTS